MRARVFVVLSLFLSAFLVSLAEAKKEQIAVARKGDLPFIRCQVCEIIAKQLFNQVHRKISDIAPKKISEYQIIEIAENICNLKKHEGDWLLRVDIVEKGDTLQLVEQESEGHCNTECKTLQHACQEVVGYHDTDIAEYLYNSKPELNQLINYICKDLTKACSTKPPPVPTDRIPGEPFVPKSSKEAEMDKILKSMEGVPGAPGMKVYSKEDLMNMQNFGLNEGDDEEDDDVDDDDELLNLEDALQKKAWREKQKQPKKMDWREKISNGIHDVKMALTGHARKASQKIKRWWKGKDIAPRSSKTNNGEL